MASVGDEFNPGDRLGEGKKMNLRHERMFGSGTAKDPRVSTAPISYPAHQHFRGCWLISRQIYSTCIVGDDDDCFEAHHVILRAKALEYGKAEFRCIIVR